MKLNKCAETCKVLPIFRESRESLHLEITEDQRGERVAESSKAVLVVDDDEAAREILSDLLERLGFSPFVAGDGRAGLEWLANAALPPQAVLLDLRMPGLDGFEVLEQYRDGGGTAPIIVLSAMDEKEVVVRAMRLGASDYLVKPIEPEELKDAIERVSQPYSPPENLSPSQRPAVSAQHFTTSRPTQRRSRNAPVKSRVLLWVDTSNRSAPKLLDGGASIPPTIRHGVTNPADLAQWFESGWFLVNATSYNPARKDQSSLVEVTLLILEHN